MENFVAAIILIAILGGAIAYIIKAKKNGQKCVGCPYSKTCSSKENGGCGCKGNKNEK